MDIDQPSQKFNTPPCGSAAQDEDDDLDGAIPAGSRRPRRLEEAESVFHKGIDRLEAMCVHFPHGVRPVHAIRRRCTDCAGGQPKEVDLCPDEACPSWPYRFGRSPFTKLGKGSRGPARKEGEK